jgi:hypothetical protein
MIKTVLSFNKVGDKHEVVLRMVFGLCSSTIFMQAFDKKPGLLHITGTKVVNINELTFWVDELEVYGRTQEM